MQLPIPLRVRPDFKIGQTVMPAVRTWYGDKYNWSCALVYDTRVSHIDKALEHRLRCVCNGVEIDFWEYADYLKLKP